MRSSAPLAVVRFRALLRGMSTSIASFRGPQILALLYMSGATVYAVFSFRNFSSVEVLSAVLLLCAVPLGLILFTATPKQSSDSSPAWLSTAAALVVAPLIFLVQFSGHRRLSHLYSNFPNHRMGVDDPGFHQDSAFHVAIIQGVLNTGYPTTGQHLEPWVSYHALSHYVDAMVLFLLGVNPWESYGLLFFAKGVSISLAVIFFSMKATGNRPEILFWPILLIVYSAFTATWHVISSHGQWFPMIVLSLVAFRVFTIAMKDKRTWTDYLLLSVLVVVFSLGKVSLGFTFAVLVGLWLFFRRPVDWRLLPIGVAWAAFLGLYSMVFFSSYASAIDRPSLGSLFGFVLQDVSALVLIAILIAGIAWFSQVNYGGSLTFALVTAMVFTTAAGTVASNGSDVFYFFHGLFSIALFLSVAFATRALFPEEESNQRIEFPKIYGPKVLAFVSAFMFAVSPVVSKSQMSPYSSFGTVWDVVSSVGDHTYRWWNEGSGPSERFTTLHALRGETLQVEPDNETPWVVQFRDALDGFTNSEEFPGGAPLLFLTAEQFEFVSNRLLPPTPWSTGLAVTAVTGMPLVFGVFDAGFGSYGFGDYREEARVRPEASVSEELLCDFGRPVIVIFDIESFSFGVACRGDN